MQARTINTSDKKDKMMSVLDMAVQLQCKNLLNHRYAQMLAQDVWRSAPGQRVRGLSALRLKLPSGSDTWESSKIVFNSLIKDNISRCFDLAASYLHYQRSTPRYVKIKSRAEDSKYESQSEAASRRSTNVIEKWTAASRHSDKPLPLTLRYINENAAVGRSQKAAVHSSSFEGCWRALTIPAVKHWLRTALQVGKGASQYSCK